MSTSPIRRESDGPILHGLDLDVQAGERVRRGGAIGRGQEHVVQLILRFYDPCRAMS